MKIINNTINRTLQNYRHNINQLDLEILMADTIEKSREFVLAHPKYKLTKTQILKLKSQIQRRQRNEPIAYITGHKEFYGLNFKVNKYTLIPRPETEMLVDEILKDLNFSLTDYQLQNNNYKIIDIGTGSGNIVISIAKNFPKNIQSNNYQLFATDISPSVLKIAKQNAEEHNLTNKITFLQSDLLNNFKFKEPKKITKPQVKKLLVVANLPYLSNEIYNSCAKNVKNFEPKSALYSPKSGLQHYENLFKQIKKLSIANYKLQIIIILEISPEQKTSINQLIKKYFSKAKVHFKKDLSNKWRMCKITL